MKNKLIHNLSTHYCTLDGVETEPRLPLLKVPTDGMEAKENVLNNIIDIEPGSSVLIGGHPSYMSLIIQLARWYHWKIYFFDTFSQKLYGAPYLNREDKYLIEQKRSDKGL